MGLAASQARLLSITARLTSNEYESQQISNAKMRLATQSQEASEAYIAALNNTQYSLIAFDSTGQSVNTSLTVASLYEYADNKNQYILTNAAGKALLANKDIRNYQTSANLDEFLEKYGLNKTFKTLSMKTLYNQLKDLKKYDTYWHGAIENYPYSQEQWKEDKRAAYSEYLNAQKVYTAKAKQEELSPGSTGSSDITYAKALANYDAAKKKYSGLLSYVAAKESMLIDDIFSNSNNNTYVGKDINGQAVSVNNKDLYEKYNEYKTVAAQYNTELDNVGVNANKAFEYDDQSKAQWYTNLWYKLNGQSTSNTGLNNFAYLNPKDGISEFSGEINFSNKISDSDSKILNSSTWISNALSRGMVNIEMANYVSEEMTIEDVEDPFVYNLKGISWTGKIYSSVSDIIEGSNSKAIAKAEAEYKQKNAEINAKDEKYQRKLNLLDTEHNAIQTEYESVKSELNKNMERSFKAFQG